MISRNNFMVENVKNQEKINFKIMLVSPNDHSINLFSKYNNITKTYKMVLFNDINLDFNISVDSNMNSNNNIDGSKYTYDTIVYIFDSKNNSDTEYIKMMYNKYFSPEHGYDYVHYFASTTGNDIQHENEYVRLLSQKEKHYYFGLVAESTMDRFVMHIVNKYVLDVYKKITKYYDGQYSDDVVIKFIKHEILKSKQLNHIKTLQENNKELSKELKTHEQRKKSEGEAAKKLEEKMRIKYEEEMKKKLEEQSQIYQNKLAEKDSIIQNQNENISHITGDMDIENTKRLNESKNLQEMYNRLSNHVISELGLAKGSNDPIAVVNEYIDYHIYMIDEKNELIGQHEKNIENLKNKIEDLDNAIHYYDENQHIKDNTICNLENDIDYLKETIHEKNDEINRLQKIIDERSGELRDMYQDLSGYVYERLGAHLDHKNPIDVIDKYVDHHDTMIDDMNGEIHIYKDNICNLERNLDKCTREMCVKNDTIDNLEEEKHKLCEIIKNNEKIIDELNNKIRELSHNSSIESGDKSEQNKKEDNEKQAKSEENYTNIFNMVLLKNFYE